MRFLGFRLYGPLASFGDVAVGERRPSLTAPTRSMLLGLVAACLGIPRTAEEDQAELERQLGLATRTDRFGRLLVDYHTAQAPDSTRASAYRRVTGLPIATRREELMATFDRDGTPHDLDTQLSQRQYRADAAYAVCVWNKVDRPRWALEEIAASLREPRFAPFIGRKAAPVGMPFEPTIIEAPDPVDALKRLVFQLDPLIGPNDRNLVLRWEGDWPGLSADRTEIRRDRVASRARWQFLTRQEHVCVLERELEEGEDVSESD